MERSTLIGIVGVAVGGVALAGGLLLAGGPLTAVAPRAEPPVGVTTSAPSALDRADAPEAALDEGRLGMQRFGGRVGQGAPPAADPAVDRQPREDVEWAEPPEALLDLGLDQVFEDEKSLLSQDPFADLPPDASQALIARRLDALLADADQVAGSYERVASTLPPESSVDALNRAADVYEHISGAIPVHPPTTGTPDEQAAWMRRQEQLVQRVQAEAERLREAARADAEVPPPPPG